MKKVMLINVLQPEETRIAILEDGVLQELYVERSSSESYVGNIYKGKIVNIEPSIQAAFVDFGVGRNGFLHISDVDPAYFEPGNGIERLLNAEAEHKPDRPRERVEREEYVERTDTRDDWTFDDDDFTEEDAAPRDPEISKPASADEFDRNAERRTGRRRGQQRSRGPAPAADSSGASSESPLPADREPRGRRGRKRGGRRERPPIVNDIPEELATSGRSVPSLDDLRLEDLPTPVDSFDEPVDEIPPPAPRRQPAERPSVDPDELANFGAGLLESENGGSDEFDSTPEASISDAIAVEPSSTPSEPPVSAADDDFGLGLLDDEDEPPSEPQRSVYRRTDRDDDFGGGVFGDESGFDADPPGDQPGNHSPGEVAETPADDSSADGPAADGGGKRLRHRRGGRGRRRGKRGLESAITAQAGDDGGDGGDESNSPTADSEDDDSPSIESSYESKEPLERSESFVDEIGWLSDDDLDGPDPMAPRDEPKSAIRPRLDSEERPEGGRRRDEREKRGRRRGRDRRDDPARAPAAGNGRRGESAGERAESSEREPRRDSRSRDARDQRDQRGRGQRLQSGVLARRPRQRPPIQDIFRRGQEVLVQVIKEGIGNKGPTLSTYVSIPGRYLVLMPGLSRVGVSRKIIDEDKRRQLRSVMLELERPRGVGFIVRTAGLERTKDELARDLSYLSRLWEVVVRRIRGLKGPGTAYQESDMIIRTIRDIVTGDIDAIYIDEPEAYERAKEFLEAVMPKYVSRLKLYDDSEPLFHRYRIEEEISKIQKRSVPLPNGGSIVIDQTEALVAIDVNSGNFRKDDNAEETAYQINLSAAKEIARQLRLRDLGGVIVNDFIDMREERHRRAVEQALRDAVERDRARTKVLRMSAFGMIEMTRQRIRPSLKRSLYRECMSCQGTGQIKTIESMAIECMRLLAYASQRSEVTRINLTVDPEISTFLQNHKRKELAAIEEKESVVINILGKETRFPESLELNCFDARGDAVEVSLYGSPGQRRN